jgi:ABC-2 type transport system permease protein
VILGAIAMTGEWRHRTITGSVLAAPNRVRLLAAKASSYSVAGITLSILVTVPVSARSGQRTDRQPIATVGGRAAASELQL